MMLSEFQYGLLQGFPLGIATGCIIMALIFRLHARLHAAALAKKVEEAIFLGLIPPPRDLREALAEGLLINEIKKLDIKGMKRGDGKRGNGR